MYSSGIGDRPAGKKAKSVKFDVQSESALLLLQAASHQIEQVFINIFTNAVDAVNNLPAGNSQEINVSASANGDEISIVVRDNGSGITEENLPKIFELFFTTKKVGEGTGLGLWVSYGIVKTFQGDIKVESTEDAAQLLPSHYLSNRNNTQSHGG